MSKSQPNLKKKAAVKPAASKPKPLSSKTAKKAAAAQPKVKPENPAPTSSSKKAADTKPLVTSKQDSVLTLLRQPKGTTIAEMEKATGWQPHSVRGFLAATVRKKLKLNLQSEKIDGERRYRIKAAGVK